jgi:MoxR-like ATPase
VTDFLQKAHHAEERYTVRDGINVARFALKLSDGAGGKLGVPEALKTAVLHTLGEEGVRYLPKAVG